MTAWSDVVAADPELADLVRRTFAVRKHATLATLRRDGSPRLSGSEVDFGDDEIHVGMMARSLKALDLRRDPRLVLHCPTVDAPDDDPAGWLGDGKIAARAVEVPGGDDGSHCFRLDVTEVVHTTVGPGADHLLIRAWHPGRGSRRVERR